jgi:protein-S-isoprenylcysteine O-methyltransferase Ste14
MSASTHLSRPSVLAQVSAADFAIRMVLGTGFAWMAGMYALGAVNAFRRVELAHANWASLAEGLSTAAISSFTLLIAWCFVVRLPPIAKSSGLPPRAAALLGGFLQFSLLLLPRVPELSVATKLASSALVIAGNALAVWILLELGRSFSIMPEARRLVTTGPYSVVRHPLYLAEALASLGVLVQFLSPWAALIVALQLGFQLLRMHYEERVLRAAFPEYDAYSRATARLVPGLY